MAGFGEGWDAPTPPNFGNSALVAGSVTVVGPNGPNTPDPNIPAGGLSLGGGVGGANLPGGFQASGSLFDFDSNVLNFGTTFFHIRSRNGFANSKALVRIMPNGTGTDQGTGGEFAELSLFGSNYGSGVDWWVDRKTGKNSAGTKFSQTLTDSDVGTEPITTWTCELDINAHSANVERYVIVRNAPVGSASGPTQVMLDIVGDTGIVGIAQNTIKLGGGNFIIQTTAGDIVFQPSGTVRLFSDALADLGTTGVRFANGWFRNAVAAAGGFVASGGGAAITGGLALEGTALTTNRINLLTTGGIQVAGTDVLLFVAGGLLNYQLAAIALGGGATATLGTIGGSGPATAAQFGWEKKRILGVDTFGPIWR